MPMPEQRELEKMDDFCKKLEMVVRIVLYGQAFSESTIRKTNIAHLFKQSNWQKASSYQLSYNKTKYKISITDYS